ncbi:MAG: hypothetical protein V4678_03175 [Patescibacteria group bacterium]
MKRTVDSGTTRGFALPTVMIASVVMLMVLLSGLVSASSTNVALRAQHHQKLAQEAVDAGRALAQACVKSGVTSWTGLYPGSTCSPASNPCPDVGAPASCYLVDTPTVRTTFKVGPPVVDAQGVRNVDVEGIVRQYKASAGTSGAAYMTNNEKGKVKLSIKDWKDLQLLASGACGLSYEAIVYCWGVSNGGQLGNGLTDGTAQPEPMPVEDASGNPSPLRFQSISAGADGVYDYSNVCGLTLDRKIYCWGRNTYGQHGDGTGTVTVANPHAYPKQTAAGNSPTNLYDQISMSPYHMCALTNDVTYSFAKRVYCWGWNGLYQLGSGTTTHSTVPLVVGNIANAAKVVTGAHHSCALNSGTAIWCWGLRPNSAGLWSCAFADATPASSNGVTVSCSDNGEARGTVPNAADTGMGVTPSVYEGNIQFAAAADGVCAIDTGNLLRCFGANFYGQLGDGAAIAPYGGTYNNFNRATWVDVVRNTSGTAIQFKESSPGASCGLDMANEAWCWGFGYLGGVGDGTALANRSRAVKVLTPSGGDGKYRRLFAGAWYNCGLDFSNKVWCWGRKNSGGLSCPTNYCTGGPVFAPQFSRNPPTSLLY